MLAFLLLWILLCCFLVIIRHFCFSASARQAVFASPFHVTLSWSKVPALTSSSSLVTHVATITCFTVVFVFTHGVLVLNLLILVIRVTTPRNALFAASIVEMSVPSWEVSFKTIQLVAAIAVSLGFHELGHVLVAQSCRVPVLSFGIFSVFGFTGAFVKLDEDSIAFQRLETYKRMSVYSAGVLFNVILSIAAGMMFVLLGSSSHDVGLPVLWESSASLTAAVNLLNVERPAVVSILEINHRPITSLMEAQRELPNLSKSKPGYCLDKRLYTSRLERDLISFSYLENDIVQELEVSKDLFLSEQPLDCWENSECNDLSICAFLNPVSDRMLDGLRLIPIVIAASNSSFQNSSKFLLLEEPSSMYQCILLSSLQCWERLCFRKPMEYFLLVLIQISLSIAALNSLLLPGLDGNKVLEYLTTRESLKDFCLHFIWISRFVILLNLAFSLQSR